MNKACISKLGWKLQNNNGEFWCDVIWGKYDQNDNIGDTSIKPMDLSLWKSIAKVWPDINKYSMWSVGNGKDVDAWNDFWINLNVCISGLQIDIPMHMQDAKVADIANEDVGWNWEELSH
ncbi:unnamed protein product [Lathyrus oleraceus]|nr:uncharacterized protein LOC127088380 [Pisum sativum]